MSKTEVIVEPNRQELFIHREFNAPRELVFRAFCEPELLTQWMGPCDLTTEIDKLDNRTHGSWRFVHRDPHGNAHAFNGVIHEVTAPERIIRTFEYEGMPERGHVSLEIMRLEDLPHDRCKVSVHVIYPSVADRDGHVQSGMQRGVDDSHSRLDQLLAEMVPQRV